ncbi:caspase family protein [Thauera sinica]|uniref:Caspase family protein n=1 Tax=Thauera sinica TaxID=2665146 RepID=A0ABW1ARK5_9RHOO|nr:caspase family protein [Thauera sp. K11]ATE59010.1 peptidase C14, caspase catalytic subunit p20 [Thauera sp. K11]
MANTRITPAELNRKLTDLSIPESELAQYFLTDEESSGFFDPKLQLNPETVDLPTDPDERHTRSEAAMNFANGIARMRRRLRFDSMLADGYKGPVLVSEGDSWFQYPIRLEDTIDHLYTKGFAVRSLDAAGDTLENMLKDREYVDAIRETKASIFLLSAGGNDALGGGNLSAHLRNFDPALSPAAHLLPSFERLLDHALSMYERVLRDVEKLPGVVTICHGYDYVIPNSGKWLGKPMISRGIKDGAVQRGIAAHMIDRFNERLRQVVARFGDRAMHVDARGAVGDTLNVWYDELHPKNPGYGRVAERFEKAIKSVVAHAPRSRARGRAQRPEPAVPTRRGWSVHVGLNRIDAAHYGGEGQLFGCHFDVEDMERIAAERGFDKRTVLLDEQATRDAVKNAVADAAAELKAGDVFMLTYAGHGSQVPDFNSDEDDGADETLCLYDGMLIDDEIYELWSKFADDVRIVMISDSCHSGSVSRAARPVQSDADEGKPEVRTRLLPPALAARAFRSHRDFYMELGRQHRGPDERVLIRELDMPLRCPVLLLAGCQDNQESQDGVGNGRFTQELLRVWDEGRFQGDWNSLVTRIVAKMPETQTPRLTLIGRSPGVLAAEGPFSI